MKSLGPETVTIANEFCERSPISGGATGKFLIFNSSVFFLLKITRIAGGVEISKSYIENRVSQRDKGSRKSLNTCLIFKQIKSTKFTIVSGVPANLRIFLSEDFSKLIWNKLSPYCKQFKKKF
jgi:hypothetical protein